MSADHRAWVTRQLQTAIDADRDAEHAAEFNAASSYVRLRRYNEAKALLDAAAADPKRTSAIARLRAAIP